MTKAIVYCVHAVAPTTFPLYLRLIKFESIIYVLHRTLLIPDDRKLYNLTL